MHLTYDYAIDRLSLRWIDFIEPISVNEYSKRFGSVAPDIIYRWAKQYKGIMVHNVSTGTAITQPYELCSWEVNAGILLGTNSQRPKDFTRGPDCIFPSKCCRDNEVYCVAGNDGVQLWFFNPNFVPDLPDAVPLFGTEESKQMGPYLAGRS